jgi:uncharacterized protein DUF929
VLALIAVVLAVFVAVANRPSPAPSPPPPDKTAAILSSVTGLDTQSGLAIGSGGLKNPFKAAGGPVLLTSDGKVRVIYVGADYCPYCAAERWSLLVALSRFGSLSGVELMTSSSTDIYPNTPTFSFSKAQLSSDSVAFQATETQTRTGAPLQTPTQEELGLLQKYDPGGSIPFLDVANLSVGVGAGFLPDVLTGKSWEDIAGELRGGTSPASRAIIGNANWITAAICRAGGNKPALCSDSSLRGLESQLG